MSNPCGLLNQMRTLSKIHGKEKALEFLVMADTRVHEEVARRISRESGIGRDSRCASRGFNDFQSLAYQRLRELLRDVEAVSFKSEGPVPQDSLAYLIVQFCKRGGNTLAGAFDKLMDLGFPLGLSNGRNNAPMYGRICSLFRDALGIFPDGSGSTGAGGSYRKQKT
ncbi:MAG: hypothetical protein ABIB47_06180 [Candidatus Woesearchaeota archaeon]